MSAVSIDDLGCAFAMRATACAHLFGVLRERLGTAAALFRLGKVPRLCDTAAMTRTHTDTANLPQPASLVGTWRRFGAAGPVYEIIGTGDELPGGGRLMRVRVVETGEELDYRLAEILDDPRER